MADVTDQASPGFRRCPHCRSTELGAVDNGQTTNLLCLRCRACWHPIHGQLVRVDSEACPGCPDRAFCRFPAVGA